MPEQEHDILVEGESCWRVARAKRAAVLVDGAAYYAALRASLLKARHSVFIVGWDIDSRTRLVGPSGAADDGMPEALGPLLTELVARRPEMKIHLLLWDYSMLYALDREPLPSLNLDWKTPEQISVCLDDVLPVGASHHQKIVTIDDAVAFSGGLDLTIRRWDTPAHDMANENRADPAGERYRPFHDIQMALDGDAARALGEIARNRWRDAACENAPEVEADDDPWPDDVEPDFTDIDIGIARTVPAADGRNAVCEVQTLYERAIAAAEKSIYIENQYLTSDCVARALTERLKENRDLEVIIVGPNVHHSWLEEHSMNAGRRRFMTHLEETGQEKRVQLLYPAVPDDDTGEGVMVHAKLMIVDDRLLRVGSSNLNNRSMGMDSECDLAVEAMNEDERKQIAAVRNRLLAEHLGCETDTVATALEEHGSLLAAIDDLSGKERTLRPIVLDGVADDEIVRTVSQFADPEKPIETPSFAGDLFGGIPTNGNLKRLAKLVGAALAVLALVAAWRYTPLSDLTSPDALVGWLQGLGGDLWMPIMIPGLFVVAGLVAFPVTVLIAVMGMMFSPLVAIAYSLGGSVLSAAVTFFIGHHVGRGPLRSLAGPKVNRVSRTLARQGILSMAALRMVPVAPFTLINLVAGASRIRLIDFMLGTILGMAPGILVMSLIGNQLARTLSDPTPMQLLWFGAGMGSWLLLCLALQFIVRKLRTAQDG